MSSKKHLLTEVQNETSGTLTISNDNLFAEQTKTLKKFSEEIPEESNLPTVSTDGGLFGWFSHKVTGEELNVLTESIQDKMIEQNKNIVKIIKEFKVVHDTFSALDKIYVQEIMTALNAAVIANNKADAGIEKIKEQQKEIESNQIELRVVTENLELINQVLQKSSASQKKDIENLIATNKKYAGLLSEIEQSVEKTDTDTNNKNESIQNDLTVLRQENFMLSKSLKVTNIISAASLLLSLILFILFMTGVLK
jgi:hypothetical protein